MTGSVAAALLAALAAGNPARRAGPLVPARPAARRAGAVVAAAVLVVVGAGAGAARSALEVSVPTVLIAAGLVVGATSLAELVSPPPRPLGGLGDRGAAWCPIAFPHLLPAQLLVATLAVGAAHGVLAALAVAVGVPGLTLAAARARSSAPLASGAARVLAALGVLASVGLVLDGIFAV